MKITEEEREDWKAVVYRMDAESFDYCWRSYSNFEEIKDKKFHKLRKAYVDAANAIEKYVNEKSKELEE